MIVERTQAGLKVARKHGVHIGRPPAFTSAQIVHAKKLTDGGERPTAVAASLNVHVPLAAFDFVGITRSGQLP